MNKLVKTSVLFIAIIVIPIIVAVAWLFWQPSDIEKNSFAYRLKVPQDAKQFPVWNKVTLPRYDVNIAVGEKPRSTILRYESSLPTAALIENAKNLEFACEMFEDNSAVCDKEIDNGRSQQLIFKIASGGKYSNVRALFIGY